MAGWRESVPGPRAYFYIYWSFGIGHFLSSNDAEGVDIVLFYMFFFDMFLFFEDVLEKSCFCCCHYLLL